MVVVDVKLTEFVITKQDRCRVSCLYIGEQPLSIINRKKGRKIRTRTLWMQLIRT